MLVVLQALKSTDQTVVDKITSRFSLRKKTFCYSQLWKLGGRVANRYLLATVGHLMNASRIAIIVMMAVESGERLSPC